MDYKILEWTEEHFKKNIEIIITCSNEYIQRIELDEGARVYLVPEEFYLIAQKLNKGGVK